MLHIVCYVTYNLCYIVVNLEYMMCYRTCNPVGYVNQNHG